MKHEIGFDIYIKTELKLKPMATNLYSLTYWKAHKNRLEHKTFQKKKKKKIYFVVFI